VGERGVRLFPELPGPPSGADKAKDKAAEVLSRPEFRPSRQSLIERVFNWLGNHLFRAFQTSVTGGSKVVSYVILAGFIAGLIYVLSRMRNGGLGRDGTGASADAEVSVHDERSSDQWIAEAESLEANGEWKLALRARYRALVARLVDRHMLTDIVGRTPGEYRHELADVLPGEAAAFAAATDLFELAWYGNFPTGPDENTRFRVLADRVLKAEAAST
jgi:hypothetical protein